MNTNLELENNELCQINLTEIRLKGKVLGMTDSEVHYMALDTCDDEPVVIVHALYSRSSDIDFCGNLLNTITYKESFTDTIHFRVDLGTKNIGLEEKYIDFIARITDPNLFENYKMHTSQTIYTTNRKKIKSVIFKRKQKSWTHV